MCEREDTGVGEREDNGEIENECERKDTGVGQRERERETERERSERKGKRQGW